MRLLLGISAAIDSLLAIVARVGAWCGVLLMVAVCVDVATRYFGVPKPFGWNSTKLQESEYWLHTFLFALVIGYAYTRQAHVRIDLFRERFPARIKYLVEILGIVLFLITYAALGTWYCYGYALSSYIEGEVSKSTIGLSNIWIVKSSLVLMFILMGLAGVSQLIKALAGFLGMLPDELVAETLGADQ